jgi:hypothetical protein
MLGARLAVEFDTLLLVGLKPVLGWLFSVSWLFVERYYVTFYTVQVVFVQGEGES